MFGNSVQIIPEYLFNVTTSSNRSNITSVTIGNSVESIGSSAFEGCNGLMSVTFENPNGGDICLAVQRFLAVVF